MSRIIPLSLLFLALTMPSSLRAQLVSTPVRVILQPPPVTETELLPARQVAVVSFPPTEATSQFIPPFDDLPKSTDQLGADWLSIQPQTAQHASRRKWTWIGAGVGTAVGFLAWGSWTSHQSAPGVVIFLPYFLAGGALVGAAVGAAAAH